MNELPCSLPNEACPTLLKSLVRIGFDFFFFFIFFYGVCFGCSLGLILSIELFFLVSKNINNIINGVKCNFIEKIVKNVILYIYIYKTHPHLAFFFFFFETGKFRKS